MTSSPHQPSLPMPRPARSAPRTGIDLTDTAELIRLLRHHFLKPGEEIPGAVFLTEVTAPGSSRRADAVHIAQWASRGAGQIDVCEVKTSRSDWLRELRDPGKAEAWWPYSSRHWLVAPNTSIARPDEVPAGWGLMVPRRSGRRFQVLIEPHEREAAVSPALLVTVVNACEAQRRRDLKQQAERLADEHMAALDRVRAQTVQGQDPELKERLALLADLEETLGCQLTRARWSEDLSGAQAGALLRRFAESDRARDHAVGQLSWLLQGLEGQQQSFQHLITSLHAALEEAQPDQGGVSTTPKRNHTETR